MQIQKTSLPYQRLHAAARQHSPLQKQNFPNDTVTFSGKKDNTGWKIAGITLMLASVPVGIAAKSVAVGAIGALAGVGLMFGPDV